MNTTIGIYDTHEMALDAAKKLKDSGYPMSRISIMGLLETEELDEQMHVLPKNPHKVAEVGIGAGTILGTTLGILTGVGIFAIPGIGFLYGAGALIGAIAGFDFGLIGGGIATALGALLTDASVDSENAKKYHDALVAGKFLVIIQGSDEEVKGARAILHQHGTHLEIAVH